MSLIRLRVLLGTLALATTLLNTLPAQAQQVIKLTAAAGHPPVFLWVKILDEYFIPEVDKRLAAAGGKYKIEWTKAYGGTLAKLGNESTAMKDGISDLGFVATIFEAAKFPLQNVTYFAPFGTERPPKPRIPPRSTFRVGSRGPSVDGRDGWMPTKFDVSQVFYLHLPIHKI